MVVPSLQESQSYVTLEALSCSIPVVAFNIGGIPDMIEHQKNGYLAEPYKAQDLAYGIEWILSDERRYKELSENARRKVIEEFTIQTMASKYLEVYKKLISKNSK